MITKKVFLLILLTLILNCKLYSQFNIGVGLCNNDYSVGVGYDHNINDNWSVGGECITVPNDSRAYFLYGFKYTICDKYSIGVNNGICKYFTNDDDVDHHTHCWQLKLGYKYKNFNVEPYYMHRSFSVYLMRDKFVGINFKYNIK